jgi:hypothetical protein
MSQGEREYYGSLLMAREDLPVDRHGFPYQVILLLMPGGGGTWDLKRDVQGRVLAWVRDEQCRPVRGENGQPLMESVPPEVERGALKWLADQRDPKRTVDLTPWWEGDTPIICGDCGVPLDRTEAVPRVLGNNVGPICMRCRDVRQELDALLD